MRKGSNFWSNAQHEVAIFYKKHNSMLLFCDFFLSLQTDQLQ